MNKAQELFQQAIARLDFVNDELNRPEEDVMTFAICHQTRSIMADLLSSYLLEKGKDISSASDLETLQALTREVDARFARLDLTAMYCHPGKLQGEEAYCMDMQRVGSCLRIANQLADMVKGDFSGVAERVSG